MELMNEALGFVAEQIAGYAISKGLGKIFTKKEKFEQRLYETIQRAITKYKINYALKETAGKVAFYDSQILLEELLKCRLFIKTDYQPNAGQMQSVLQANPNIIKPTKEDLDHFFQIFDDMVGQDDILKKLELQEYKMDPVIQILEGVNQVVRILENGFLETAALLEQEYTQELSFCLEDIRRLKPQTALQRVMQLEPRILQNSKHVTEKLRASLFFTKAVCFEACDEPDQAYQAFISAYNLGQNLTYAPKACSSFYILGDDRYIQVKQFIEQADSYNPACFAIDAFNSADLIDFLRNKVPPVVFKDQYFKRFIFNYAALYRQVDPIGLVELLGTPDLYEELPTQITYDNLRHWVFVLNTLFNRYFYKRDFPYTGSLKRDKQVDFMFNLCRILSEAILDSELNQTYKDIVFWYYWMKLELEPDELTLGKLKDAYRQVQKPGEMFALLMVNTLSYYEGFEAAAAIIYNYPGPITEDIGLFRTFLYFKHQRATKDTLIEYLGTIKEVNEKNLRNLCSQVIAFSRYVSGSNQALKDMLAVLHYQREAFRRLLFYLLAANTNESLGLKEIVDIKVELSGLDSANFFVSTLFADHGYLQEALAFLDSFVDKTKESRSLQLYIEVLNRLKNEHQPELLEMLAFWRLNCTCHPAFIDLELELRELLGDWSGITEVLEFALERLPEDEYYLGFYLKACDKINRSIDTAFADKLMNYPFVRQEILVRVAEILCNRGFYVQGVELLYRKAIERGNTRARLKFIDPALQIPAQMLVYYQVAELGRYVELEYDGKTRIIQLDGNTQLAKTAVGKNVGDCIEIVSGISDEPKQFRIKAVMNKYLALYTEIFKEAEDDFSELPLVNLKLPDNDPAEMEKVLVKAFGKQGGRQKRYYDENLSAYHNGEITFTELAVRNYDGDSVISYYTLTGYAGGFMTIPFRAFQTPLVLTGKTIVVDFTSGLLFFELSKEFGLSFGPLIAPQSLIDHIDRRIQEEHRWKNSKGAISVLEDRVIPIFRPEGYYEKRVAHITEIRDWFITNCKIEAPKERLNLLRSFIADDTLDHALEVVIDLALLAARENHLLITNDLCGNKFLRLENLATPEHYLQTFFPEHRTTAGVFMLTRRYLGVAVDRRILFEAFIQRNEPGKEHVFTYALRNLTRMNINSVEPLTEVILFLKDLALCPTPLNVYTNDATNVFNFLIAGLTDKKIAQIIMPIVQKEFLLLPLYLDATVNALTHAFAIRIKTDKIVVKT